MLGAENSLRGSLFSVVGLIPDEGLNCFEVCLSSCFQAYVQRTIKVGNNRFKN